MDMSSDIELIAIGASAGGVDALGSLLQALPAGLAAAVVIVLHIAPGTANLLPKLYADRCLLPLKEAEDKEFIAPGTVYFAPADYHLLIEPDKSFALSNEPPVNYSRPAIDLTFESAAFAYGGKLLGIILTGASADGAAGLRCVRRQGGHAWVQNPAHAHSALMPEAAIKLAGADKILDLTDIKRHLEQMKTLNKNRSGKSSRD
jgi:two-component system chemotaxis response regulator CheB